MATQQGPIATQQGPRPPPGSYPVNSFQVPQATNPQPYPSAATGEQPPPYPATDQYGSIHTYGNSNTQYGGFSKQA